MSVRGFHLVSGQDIICSVLSEDETSVKIKNPAMVMISPNGGVGMLPFILFKNPENAVTDLMKDKIVFMYNEMNQELVNEYNRVFGSGIVVSAGMPSGIQLS